jgi:hypothetical protein
MPESDSFCNGLLCKTVLFEYSVKNYSNIEYFSILFLDRTRCLAGCEESFVP